MSTMDYLEFKEHIEHAFTQKDKAEYYKKSGVEKVYNRASSFNKDEVRKKMLDFISQFNDNEQAIKNMWKTNTDPGVVVNQLDKDAWKNSKGAASRVVSNELTKRYDRRHEIIRNMLAYSKSVSGTTSGVFTSDELSTINKLASAFHNNVIVEGTARNLMAKLQADLTKKSSAGMPSNIKHSSIAGVPSRLRSKMQDAVYKKTGYQSKGSMAGAPANAKATTSEMSNKAAANARFSASIKSAVDACNRTAAETQKTYVEATSLIYNAVSKNKGEVNSIIRSVNAYNDNVRKVRSQTITKKNVTFGTVANGRLYQGVHDVEIPVDANRQFISFSAGAQKLTGDKYVYKPKMLLIDSDPGTYKEV